MSHHIPVFFFPIEESRVPASMPSWHSAVPLIVERQKQRVEYGLRESASRNWWHQHPLSLICQGLGIGGLEFIQSEIISLDQADLRRAAQALKRVVAAIEDGLPDLGPELEKQGSIWWLRHYSEGDATVEASDEVLRQAFDEAQPVLEVNVETDSGYQAIVGWFSFIKSLDTAITECLTQDKHLLYVMPQP